MLTVIFLVAFNNVLLFGFGIWIKKDTCRQTFKIHPYAIIISFFTLGVQNQGISILSSIALLCSRFSDPFVIMRYMIRVWKFKCFSKNPNYVMKIAYD